MGFLIAILILTCIVVAYLLHLRDMKLLRSVTSPDRGTKAERKLLVKLLKKGVHPQAIFHDLYVPKRNGEFAQIDIVVATPQGLLAIEVKDYSGWIFGNERQKYWTKVLNYGKEKYRFYNPIMQNEGHIKALRAQSEQFSRLPIYNIILFAGNCELKNVDYFGFGTYVGYTAHINRVLKQLRKFNMASYTDKNEVIRILQDAHENGNNPEIVNNHIRYVQEMSAGQPDHKIVWMPRFLYRWRWPRW